MANSRRDAAKEGFWRRAIARQAESGLSVRAFCRQEELAESAFYSWRRTLANRDRGTAKADSLPSFVPAVVKQERPLAGPIELVLASGATLRLPAAMAAGRVAELVRALESRGPQ